MKKLKLNNKYLFLWNDTYSHVGWFSDEEIDKKTVQMLHESVGYLIKQTNTWYIIAQHKNNTPDFMPWANISWIPKGSVKKVISF